MSDIADSVAVKERTPENRQRERVSVRERSLFPSAPMRKQTYGERGREREREEGGERERARACANIRGNERKIFYQLYVRLYCC